MTRRRLFLLVSVLLVVWLATGVYQVRPGERAVVRRFGAVVGEPRLPGLHFGLPWGLDQVDRVAVDAQREFVVGYQDEEGPAREELPLGQLLTGDNNLLNLRLTVYYRVDAAHVVEFVMQKERTAELLPRLAEETMVATVAGERIDPILFGRASGLEERLRQGLAERAAGFQLGVSIDQVNISFAQPPAELVEVYREVNRARTRREIVEKEALGLRTTELSLARRHAQTLKAEAAAKAQDKKTRATAEAESFLVLLRSLPTDPTARGQAQLNLYLNRMTEVLGKMQVKTVSDLPADQNVILPGPTRDR